MALLFSTLFKKGNKFAPFVAKINSYEEQYQSLSPESLKEKSFSLKERAQSGESLDSLLYEAFALVREASRRTLKQRHFDVQLIGGIVLHRGAIAEMITGEGKTLTATSPVYLNALAGKGVHVITVNDYLARRDTVWMGQIYHALGLSVGCLTHESAYLYDPSFLADKKEEIDRARDVLGSFTVFQDYLRPISRHEAYRADVTYGTNHEFGFDYLRDNLSHTPDMQVQRGHPYAIIDEVDSILIDEARTPLIISMPDTEASEYHRLFARVARDLRAEEDYIVDEKTKTVSITDEGINKVESAIKLKNLYAPENLRLVRFLEESLKAHALFRKDKEYVVKLSQDNEGEIIIVDEFTGRLMHGRRYSGGLHQAIEAKEGVPIKQESRTLAQITIQNYFRLYKKIAGMTGTAQTSAEEFFKVYRLEVVSIPPNRPLIRKNLPDLIFKTRAAKYRAVVEEIRKRHLEGQPMLVGTASIEHNELVSKLLTQAGVPHETLNAKNHEREGAIIAQAGKFGAVTLATNMAGRGVDIILGGNPPSPEDAEEIKQLGGLHVVGTERHEARRIDNQLRGRSGRQGDPGSSQFFLSLEDELLRIFGGDRIKALMDSLHIPEDQPIESSLVMRAVSEAQHKVEGFNFDARKHLLEYDDVLNKQRDAVYKKRQELLILREHPQILGMLDLLWMNHLETMEALREAVSMRAYAQKEPLTEYKRESYELYRGMMAQFETWKEENAKRLKEMQSTAPAGQVPLRAGVGISSAENSSATAAPRKKVGRNAPCWCGAKKPDGTPVKYKHCHGKS